MSAALGHVTESLTTRSRRPRSHEHPDAKGLDPATDDSADDADGDGWTNIEEYLHARAVELVGA